MFFDFLKIGIQHILDPKAYDHVLYVLALAAVYAIKDWKKILILVTAFTVGHSISLALSVYNIVRIEPSIIETLIPVTIIITGLFNIFNPNSKSSMNVLYMVVTFFGLIHGMGFSNYLNALLGDESKFQPLLAFNLGVEVGQLAVVASSMVLTYLFIDVLKINQKYWVYIVSIGAIIAATQLLFK